MKDTNPTLKSIAERFIARVEHLEFKGKQRDKLALEFFVGCCVGLEIAGHPDAQCVLNTTALLIATRGYGEVVRIASDDERREAA